MASLEKSHGLRKNAEAAALRILELQQQRQKVAWERAEANRDKLTIKASLSGMVVLENVWKGGTMGHPQEGDQLWTGQTLMKIFDPSEMEVHAQVGEPDGAALTPGTKAWVKAGRLSGSDLSGGLHLRQPGGDRRHRQPD